MRLHKFIRCLRENARQLKKKTKKQNCEPEYSPSSIQMNKVMGHMDNINNLLLGASHHDSSSFKFWSLYFKIPF